jgi:hypothetical protein
MPPFRYESRKTRLLGPFSRNPHAPETSTQQTARITAVSTIEDEMKKQKTAHRATEKPIWNPEVGKIEGTSFREVN